MGKVISALVCGLAIGLGVGEWFASLPADAFQLSTVGRAKEAVYRGQPTSYWLAQLQDHDQAFRQQAIQALEQIGPKDENVVRALAGMLKDRSKGVRLGAAFALRRLGRQTEAAIPNLIGALQDEDCFVRVNAAYALRSIGPQDEKVIAALIPALKDESAVVRRAVLKILLGVVGSGIKVLSPAVCEALKQAQGEVSKEAPDTFARMERN